MDIEKVIEAVRSYLRSREALQQAEQEAEKLKEAASDFYFALHSKMGPEGILVRWKVLVKAAERVLGRELKE